MEHANVLQVLADPTRLKIVTLLVQRNYCVSVLAEILGVSAPAVSQHMKLLQQAGLVSSEKIGYHTHYRVNRDILYAVANELQALAAVETRPCEKQGSRCNRFNGGCHGRHCGFKNR